MFEFESMQFILFIASRDARVVFMDFQSFFCPNSLFIHSLFNEIQSLWP